MAIDLMDPIGLTVSQSVLNFETNDARFEAFCRDVVSLLEGGSPILTTSTSWDLGRDGVGVGAARGIYVCASLRNDVDQKALNDLARIRETTKGIEKLYFCSSHKLSEQRITNIQSALEREADQEFSVTCLGATQLTEVSARDPAIFDRYYRAEHANVLRAISVDPSDEAEQHGLRLALIAAAGEDSNAIRRELYRAGLLEVLQDGLGRTAAACAKQLSARLQLGYNISDAAVAPHLNGLAADGLVTEDAGVFTVSEQGTAHIERLHLGAAERFLTIKNEIRSALENAIGGRLADAHFIKVWRILEDRITAHFHARGVSLVAEVSALLENSATETPSESTAPLSFLEEMATAVAGTSTHPQQQEELRQAVLDLFLDRTGPAAEWLVRVCVSFLACCAIGLEHTSGVALRKLFARTALIFDSDVILSLLGDSEPDHHGVLEIASRWARLGGKLFVPEPVLEEVAYHASIAQRDFDEVRRLLPGTEVDRERIIENVFVRAFAHYMAHREAKLGQWRTYISQFRGQKPYDSTNLFAHLNAEFAFEKLPSRSEQYERLEVDVFRFLGSENLKRGQTGKIASDKARRDARLYAELVNYVRMVRASDPGATCLLVSSAHRLTAVERRFGQSAEPQLVVAISTVLYLLSLLPQVSLGIKAMKAFLFEDRRLGFSSDLERTILRLVRSSSEVMMPWAKRGALMRTVRERLIEDARREGQMLPDDANTSALERRALLPENRENTIQILKQALDNIVVDSRTEQENARLRRENEELKRQLETRKGRSH